MVRWIGGGVVEVATPDNKQLAYVDAWVWNNAAYGVLKVDKPAEFGSATAFKDYVAAKSPDAVLVLLSHDHGDHMGDYFEMLKTLVGAGLPVKTTGQSDLMRGGLVQKFKDNGLDAAQVVLNGGAVDLSTGAPVQVLSGTGTTPATGISFPIEFTVGNLSGAEAAGTYSDVINVTVTAN